MGQIATSKRFAEFFAGIGLVHEALRDSGWECVYANDIDPKKEAMYKGQFGPSTYFHLEDVWQTKKIVDEMEDQPFLATASFPCTDLSLAGHCAGFEGEHSSTYFGFINVLKALGDNKPKMVLLENVPGFLTSKNGEDFVKAVTSLSAENYWIDCIVLDAKSFVPQSRPRVFVFGFHDSLRSNRIIRKRQDWNFGDPWQSAIDEAGSLRPNSLLKLIEETTLPTGWATMALRPPKQAKYSLASVIDIGDDQDWWDDKATEKHYKMLSGLHRREVESRVNEGGVHVGTVYRRCRNDEMRAEVRFDNLAGCLRTPRGGSARQIVLVIVEGQVRFRWMSPIEYARLQGAPSFTLAKNTIQSLFGFGDGVCVPVIRWVDQHVLSPIFDDETATPSPGVRKSSRSKKVPTRRFPLDEQGDSKGVKRMSNREITDKRQPPKPGRGALPAEIKAWIEKCRAQSTPEELAELEQTGDDLKAIFNRIGFDPASQTFAPRDRSFEIEFNPDCKQS